MTRQDDGIVKKLREYTDIWHVLIQRQPKGNCKR
jgi:hypothetical protein